MKRFFYMLYAASFNICRIFPLKSNRVSFLSPHRENFTDSLGMVLKEVESRGGYEIVKISSADLSFNSSLSTLLRALKFFTIKAYLLATSKYVFLNDNFMPMGSLLFSKKAIITQLWHAEGAFKKFGLDIPQPEQVRKRELAGARKLSFVVCSSEQIAPIYAKAFGVDESKVLPLGSPRSDEFFKNHDVQELKERFFKQHPQCMGKKIILYAPTFRDSEADDTELLTHLDVEAFNKRFGETSSLLVKLHPQIHHNKEDLDGAVDVTSWDNVGELIMICDAMITDYSSVCMDAALIGKPLYFYAFDIEKYASERQFYFDYEAYVPGPVARDFSTLLNLLAMEISESYLDKIKEFKTFNFGSPDGTATKKIVEAIMS